MREAFRFWSVLKKFSILFAVFLTASLVFEFQSYLEASRTRDVTLVWSLPPEDDVAGFNVYYGPTSRYDDGFDHYMYVDNLVYGDYDVSGPKAEYVLSDLDANLSYWVSITAYDFEGNESSFSNEKRVGQGDFSSGDPIVTCQAVPGVSGQANALRFLQGWGPFLLLVSLWLLRLRRQQTRDRV